MAETIASMAVRIGLDISGFQKNMNEFQKTWGKVGKQMQDTGSKIGTSFTAAGLGLAAGLGFAVKTAAEFDAQMARVGAIAGASEKELQAMRQTALDLGASTSKSASEVAQGMELMAAKGYEANEVIAAMPGVIAAAEASGEDMALVADTVASALNAFGLEASEASRVADVLAMSANTSAAGVQDLQYAFKYAAPVANSLGISLEELAAATGIMADAGMKGEQAGTTLRAALLRLTDPSKEAKKMMDQLGISVTDANGKFLPFDKIIQQLRESTAGMTDAQKAQALSTIFGTEAMTGMLSLVEAGPEKFRALTSELQNSGGASAEAAAQMKDNLAGSMEELSGAIETLQISFGSALAPAIRIVADALSGLVNWFNQLPQPVQNFLAIGSALVAVLLLLTGVVGFLVAGLGLLLSAQWAVILPIAGWIAAIVGVVAALGGLVAGIVLAYNNIDWFREMVSSAWESIKGAFNTALQFIKNIVTTVMTAVFSFLSQIWSQIQQFWSENGDMIKQATQNVWNVIKTIISVAMNIISAIMSVVWPVIKTIIVSTWNAIKGVIQGAIDVILGIIKFFSALFTGDWKALWEATKQILSGAVKLVWNLINLYFLGKIIKVITSFGGLLKSLFASIWGAVKSIFSASINAVRNFVSKGFNFIKSLVTNTMSTIWNVIKSIWNRIKSTVSSVVSGIWSTIKSKFSSMRTAVSNTMNNVWSTIKNIWNRVMSFFKSIDLKQIGKDIIQGLINGIKSMGRWVRDAIADLAGWIPQWIKDKLGISSPSKVMIELGKFTGEGLAIGLGNTLKNISRQANAMAMAAIPNVRAVTVPNINTQKIPSASTSIDSRANYREPQYAIINIGGYEARGVIRYFTEEQERESNRVRRARGLS